MAKTIRLDGEIGWEITASNLSAQIEGETELDLIINSGGGSILEGFAIFNILRDFKGTITARIDLAASMASVIAMAADKIVMRSTSSLMMIHRPWTGAVGEAEDLRSIADTLDKLEGMISSIYMERVGKNISPDQLSGMLAAETWLDGSEAVELGFADELAEDDSKNMLTTVLAAMSTKKAVAYDLSKLAAKVKDIENGEKSDLKSKLSQSGSLSEIEAVIRNAFSASRSEATAIVAAVKKQSHSDCGPKNADITAMSAEITAIFERHTQS
tara:strand:- start:5451 stop:6263 length:813 start_codon:yes stop_codon:yes gene_type:complete